MHLIRNCTAIIILAMISIVHVEMRGDDAKANETGKKNTQSDNEGEELARLKQLSPAAALAELDRAIRKGELERSKTVLQAFPELIEKPDKFKRTPLFNAVHAGQTEIVRFLIRQGAEIGVTNIYGDTPLHRAAQTGSLDIVKLMIENNAFVDTRNKKGETPLFKAASYDRTEVAKYLISRGAIINRADKTGSTPLHRATLKNKVDMVKLLLKYQANAAAKDNDGNKAADFARNPEIKSLLAAADPEGN